MPHQWRWALLLLASCYFYMIFKVVYILILGFTIVIDYFAGIFIENAEGQKRKYYLIVSLIANIGVLVVFKYWNFLNVNLSSVLNSFNAQNPVPFLEILLPIGLSFHTFQAMSYTIEVYRGKQKAEKHFGIYSLYVMFYPQLVAGPIERPQNLLPQFHKEQYWNYERFKSGLMLMLWGFFKKVVIADRLSILVNETYGDIDNQNGATLFVATLFFTFQIYCDFSGYSDIAIGSAKIMGYDLMQNFNAPYFSKSISEFWSRWHISLSTWFKDYLYIPLGGNRVGVPRWYFNLMLVFVVSGIWHGANWTFVVWGALHGIYLILALVRDRYLSPKFRMPAAIQVVVTFLLVATTWIFFRADSIENAFKILDKIANISFTDTIHSNVLSGNELIFCVLLVVLLMLKDRFYAQINTKNDVLFWVKCIGFGAAIVLLGVFEQSQFIYFQF